MTRLVDCIINLKCYHQTEFKAFLVAIKNVLGHRISFMKVNWPFIATFHQQTCSAPWEPNNYPSETQRIYRK